MQTFNHECCLRITIDIDLGDCLLACNIQIIHSIINQFNYIVFNIKRNKQAIYTEIQQWRSRKLESCVNSRDKCVKNRLEYWF